METISDSFIAIILGTISVATALYSRFRLTQNRNRDNPNKNKTPHAKSIDESLKALDLKLDKILISISDLAPEKPILASIGKTAISHDIMELAVSKVEPNPYLPSREFDERKLADLAESIRNEGLIQPIVVREVDGRYQLIAGEHRWRAFKILKLAKIPARIIKAGDSSSALVTLIENLQRENLNPIEESLGYASLLRDFDLTQDQIAERVGKGSTSIANSLRLLTLPTEVRGYLSTGLLSANHAEIILGLEAKAEQTLIARRIIEEGISVRGTETLIETIKTSGFDTRKGTGKENKRRRDTGSGLKS